MMTCKVSQCDKKIYTAKSGLCRGHYERLRKGTEVDTPLKIHDSSQGCKADECEEKHFSYGYCKLHSSRFRNGIDLYRDYRPIDGSRGCDIIGCSKQHYGLGYCVNHYGRINRFARKRACIRYMGGKCSDCGGEFRPECYDFDNVTDEPGHENIGNMMSRNASDEAILDELKRCELVCANCHRTRTEKRYGELIVRSKDPRTLR